MAGRGRPWSAMAGPGRQWSSTHNDYSRAPPGRDGCTCHGKLWWCRVDTSRVPCSLGAALSMGCAGVISIGGRGPAGQGQPWPAMVKHTGPVVRTALEVRRFGFEPVVHLVRPRASRTALSSRGSNWLHQSGPKVAPRHKHRNAHENSPRESCELLDRTILTGISVRTFL